MEKTPSVRGAHGLVLHSFSYRQSAGGSRYSMRLALSRGEWHITEEGKEFWSQDDEIINTYPVSAEDAAAFAHYLETLDFEGWEALCETADAAPDAPRAHIGFTVRDADNEEQYFSVSDMALLPPAQKTLFHDVRERLQALCRYKSV